MKHLGKLGALLLACMMASLCFAGCVDPHAGKTVVSLWGSAETEEATAFNTVIDTYNRTNQDNIYVEYQPLPGAGYETTIDRTLAGVTGPDLFYVHEKYIKRWARLGYLVNLQSRIDASGVDLDAIWDSAVNRYRYDPVKNTNNPDDDLYCLPKDVSPTALYYNETIMRDQGITVISVDESQIDAFNNEGAADRRGKTKADYGITGNVVKKGFYREKPYDGSTGWQKPVYANGKVVEKMIFNNRIAMSWDEIEDLASIFTLQANNNIQKRGKMEWGYFTEWWFNYGWGVGGDCAEDTTGEGDWVFTLGSEKQRYAVVDTNGNYVLDNLRKNVFVDADKKDAYLAEHPDHRVQYSSPLPSQRTAFERFCYLSRPDGALGYAVCPTPSQLGMSTGAAFFAQGKVAMLVQQNSMINSFRRAIGNSFDWDVAPLPVYKEYADITAPDNDIVVNKGIEIGHSGGRGFGIWTQSQHIDETFKVMLYLAGEEAQKIISNIGYTMANQRELAMTEYIEYQENSGNPPQNIRVFAENCDVQRPADWWYMPDGAWIDKWSDPLNQQVRNNTMTIKTLFDDYSAATNEILRGYKNK